MLFLDYSLPRSSRYILFVDAPFRYSWRHLIQYFNANIIRKKTGIELLAGPERLLHFGLAFLEVLPILGMAVALLDRLVFYKKPKIVTEYSKSDMNVAGFMLAKIVPIYCKIFGSDAQKEAGLQEACIIPRYIEEMKQIARSTGICYSNVLLANTILDRLALFGGSIKAFNQSATKIATSYFHSQGRGDSVLDVSKSFWRYDVLNETTADASDDKKALLKVCMQETIASCIYDGTKQKLLWAFGSDYSANRPYRRYNLKPLLQKSHSITLLHNIDFPMGLLAPFTRLFIREKTPHSFAFVAVGWLGMIGTYSGINEHGLAVAACSVPGASCAANPNHLIIRQILEEAKTIDDAHRIIEKTTPSAPMNLIITTGTSLARIELARSISKNPTTQKK